MPRKRVEETDEAWEAAIEYIRALEKCWRATVRVEIGSDGALYSTSVAVRVRVTVPQFETPGRALVIEKWDIWPRRDYTRVGNLVYHLLMKADHEIGTKYHKQAELPF